MIKRYFGGDLSGTREYTGNYYKKVHNIVEELERSSKTTVDRGKKSFPESLTLSNFDRKQDREGASGLSSRNMFGNGKCPLEKEYNSLLFESKILLIFQKISF